MMQKRSWKLAAGSLIAAVAMVSAAFAQEVTSNIVGYVKVDVVGGQFSLLSTPFDQVDGSANTVNNVLGDQLGAGTSVFAWDPVGASYTAANRLGPIWTNGDTALPRGSGFWVNPGADATLLLMGEVPDAQTDINIVAGPNLVGNPVPVEMALNDSGLSAAPAGSSIFFWTGAGYTPSNKLGPNWIPNETLALGEGLWLISGGDFLWTEAAP